MTKTHKCDKENVKWDKRPAGFDNEITWYGKCRKCARSVYEVYSQEPELYDAVSGEEI